MARSVERTENSEFRGMFAEMQADGGDIKSGDILGRGILPGVPRFFESLLWRLFRFDRVSDLYSRLLRDDGEAPYLSRALRHLGVSYEVSDSDLARIPVRGPVIVTANHPFGAVEGLILGLILRSVRPDVKLMGNAVLKNIRVPEFLDTFIFVDPFGRKDSVATNIRPVREAMRWVSDGGALGVFPAGEVSHFRWQRGRVADPEWNDTVARIVKGTKAAVVPVFFEGLNSALFQLLGLLHPRLRTLLLPREMFNKADRVIRVRIGRRIPYEKLAGLASNEAVMRYLRMRTYMLENRREDQAKRGKFQTGQKPVKVPVYPPIAPPRKTDLLPDEVCALPPAQRLIQTREFSVFHAESSQIPLLLHEIGRQREITFRECGEGTGTSIDLDRFDRYYTHLFLWDNRAKRVAGAYRIGLTDRIVTRYGTSGLYTRTLFHYGTELLDRIGPALELGRSFVRCEYQKDYQPLMLLWKGIGRFVAARPRCKVLFGPVSINRDYQAVSRDLIVAYSKTNRRSEYARLVKGVNPVRLNPARKLKFKATCNLIGDIHDLSELISDIERDQKGIPILLKHYMKLGGSFLGFSVDRNFSDVMDALIMVDLTRVEPAILGRYMGEEGAAAFLGCHGFSNLADCA